jgi:hypothetical protein
MVWADGALAAQTFDSTADPPYNGHGWVPGSPLAVTLDRALLNHEPGDLGVYVAVYRPGDPKPRFDLSATVATAGARPAFALPTVATAQVLRPSVLRSLFHTHPPWVVEDGTAAALAAAGVTSLEGTIFRNPADGNLSLTYAQWQAWWEAQVGSWVDWCAANGWYFIGQGDDLFRFENQRDWTHTGSYRVQAFQYVAQRLAASGRCLGVEVVDEVGEFPADYAPEEFIAAWRAAGGPPLAWPNRYPVNWEVPAYSDYASRYWHYDEWAEGRPSPGGMSMRQMSLGVARAALGVDPTRPWHNLITCAGPFYKKNAAGSDYQHGLDRLHQGGCTAADVIGQAWLSLAHGSSGFRLYSYDQQLWRDHRASAAVGTSGLQTGCMPGHPQWDGVAAALSSVAAREAVLAAGPAYLPVTSGPWVAGRRGNLTWAVNTSERTLPSPNGPGTVITPAGESAGSDVPASCAIVW